MKQDVLFCRVANLPAVLKQRRHDNDDVRVHCGGGDNQRRNWYDEVTYWPPNFGGRKRHRQSTFSTCAVHASLGITVCDMVLRWAQAFTVFRFFGELSLGKKNNDIHSLTLSCRWTNGEFLPCIDDCLGCPLRFVKWGLNFAAHLRKGTSDEIIDRIQVRDSWWSNVWLNELHVLVLQIIRTVFLVVCMGRCGFCRSTDGGAILFSKNWFK